MPTHKAYARDASSRDIRVMEVKTPEADPSRYLATMNRELRAECPRVGVKWPVLIRVDCEDSVEDQPPMLA